MTKEELQAVQMLEILRGRMFPRLSDFVMEVPEALELLDHNGQEWVWASESKENRERFEVLYKTWSRSRRSQNA